MTWNEGLVHTECQHGHPLSGKNLYTYTSTSGKVFRTCIECRRRRDKARARPAVSLTAAQRRYKRKLQAVSLPSAANYGKRWTGPELELIMRSDLTARDLSVLLGRSMYAVRTARSKCRSEPRYERLLG